MTTWQADNILRGPYHRKEPTPIWPWLLLAVVACVVIVAVVP